MGLFTKEKNSKQNKKLKEEKEKELKEKIKKQEAELEALKDDGINEEKVEEDIEEFEKAIEESEEPSGEKLTWIVENVATQTEPVIYNNKDKRAYTIQEALVKILNRLEE